MKVAIDISPLTTGHYLQHRVRGTGTYLRGLMDSLSKEYPSADLIFFKRGDKLDSQIDVIHYPYFEPFFKTLPFNPGLNVVVTVHDLTPLVFKDKFPRGVKGELKWQIQRRSLQKTGAIIADSLSSKKDIEKAVGYDGNKIHVVYLAASPIFKPLEDSTKKQVIKKYNLPDKFLLYVGDVTWNKNLPRLIEAINQTDFNLVIVGQAFKNTDYDRKNPWNQDLAKSQNLASKNKKIISLGFVSNEDLVNLYNAAMLFVMPSLYEGFGLPVLEAMQSGCPVITSNKGSLEEVGGEAVFYVDPYNSDSIKNAVIRLSLDTDLRKKLSEKGIIQAKKFNWKKTARETMGIYERLYKQNNK